MLVRAAVLAGDRMSSHPGFGPCARGRDARGGAAIGGALEQCVEEAELAVPADRLVRMVRVASQGAETEAAHLHGRGGAFGSR